MGNGAPATRLRASPPGPEGFEFVELIFENIARDYLGFAWKHTPFACLHDKMKFGSCGPPLRLDIDAVKAAAAVAAKIRSPYAQGAMSRPLDIASFQRVSW